jgi:hypothetical protein
MKSKILNFKQKKTYFPVEQNTPHDASQYEFHRRLVKLSTGTFYEWRNTNVKPGIWNNLKHSKYTEIMRY